MAKITAYDALTDVAGGDIIPIVDVSDTTMGANGTNKKVTLSTIKENINTNVFYNALSRQAIMNGNFDIWQRGTSVALADATQSYQADRWYDVPVDDGGTLPTLTRSRQLLTSGDIANSFFYTRLTTNGAGTSLGAGSYHEFSQKIENGVRNLCGLNKKVTLSFYARSSIANKKIGVYLAQVYGTGGSPSSAEIINGTNWTLTSTWTKYEYTFTTNTLVGKTFGTGYDDYLTVSFFNMWGTTYQDRVGDTVAETYVGSGNIDIAQVQLNAGDEALEFNPKSYEEELRACQRYYQVYITPHMVGVMAMATTAGRCGFVLPVRMRATPTATVGALPVWDGEGTPTTITGVVSEYLSPDRVQFDFSTAGSLKVGNPAICYSTGTATLQLQAEI